MNSKEKWLRLLTIVSQLDAPLNATGILNCDKETMLAMRRECIQKLLTDKPDFISVEVSYRPEYFSYSERTKAAANKMMKEDIEHYSYMHYLKQIEPCEEDVEDPNKSTVDIVADIEGQRFYFNIPIDDMPSEYAIPIRPWKPDKKIYHERVTRDNEEYLELISSIQFEE